MSIRVGINGFGRMGRLALRVALDCPDYDIVHINEIAGGPRTAAHLLEFDSILFASRSTWAVLRVRTRQLLP